MTKKMSEVQETTTESCMIGYSRESDCLIGWRKFLSTNHLAEQIKTENGTMDYFERLDKKFIFCR